MSDVDDDFNFLNCQWDVMIITSGAEFLMSINTFDSSTLVCLPLPPESPVLACSLCRPLEPVEIAVTTAVPGAGICVTLGGICDDDAVVACVDDAVVVVVDDGVAVFAFVVAVVNVADAGDDDDRFPVRVYDVNADVAVDVAVDVVVDVALASSSLDSCGRCILRLDNVDTVGGGGGAICAASYPKVEKRGGGGDTIDMLSRERAFELRPISSNLDSLDWQYVKLVAGLGNSFELYLYNFLESKPQDTSAHHLCFF
ncbi:hypothetical protein FF38_07712 [Lucilia cuprina]|uniref:Uncharacterized protein n=1 Tax=Lucilia cuprina TaxID=7375 RepID=A0A0L0BKY5_LUCCU|nr:hypothetical protein FF38_07712 [Lucilia cuprina]